MNESKISALCMRHSFIFAELAIYICWTPLHSCSTPHVEQNFSSRDRIECHNTLLCAKSKKKKSRIFFNPSYLIFSDLLCCVKHGVEGIQVARIAETWPYVISSNYISTRAANQPIRQLIFPIFQDLFLSFVDTHIQKNTVGIFYYRWWKLRAV